MDLIILFAERNMSSVSIVYKNIYFYRLIMNLIYGGKYNQRYSLLKKIIERERPASVIEFCFGDVQIAQYCASQNIKWTGYDLNESFVKNALSHKLDARLEDIMKISDFPKADLFIISGSLYHFNSADTNTLFTRVFENTKKFLISEPVRNLSDSKGLIGKIARRSANAGKGEEHFRYNEQTFKAALDKLATKFAFNTEKVGPTTRDIVVFLTKP